jgi:hypothetical protein
LIETEEPIDPDDILTEEETGLFKKAEGQLRRGDAVTLAELELDLKRKNSSAPIPALTHGVITLRRKPGDSAHSDRAPPCENPTCDPCAHLTPSQLIANTSETQWHLACV